MDILIIWDDLFSLHHEHIFRLIWHSYHNFGSFWLYFEPTYFGLSFGLWIPLFTLVDDFFHDLYEDTLDFNPTPPNSFGLLVHGLLVLGHWHLDYQRTNCTFYHRCSSSPILHFQQRTLVHYSLHYTYSYFYGTFCTPFNPPYCVQTEELAIFVRFPFAFVLHTYISFRRLVGVWLTDIVEPLKQTK